MTLKEYRHSQLDKRRIEATEDGKQAVKDFVSALNRRIKVDAKHDGQTYRSNIDNKYALCSELFFKWLAEIKEFDKNNTPLFNVPIITIWRDHKGKIQYSHNMLTRNNIDAHLITYRFFKSFLRIVLHLMRHRYQMASRRKKAYSRKKRQ